MKNKNIENTESRRYVVVTPCRNEENNIPNLVQSITAQTIRPELWVIVDDGSTDKPEFQTLKSSCSTVYNICKIYARSPMPIYTFLYLWDYIIKLYKGV